MGKGWELNVGHMLIMCLTVRICQTISQGDNTFCVSVTYAGSSYFTSIAALSIVYILNTKHYCLQYWVQYWILDIFMCLLAIFMSSWVKYLSSSFVHFPIVWFLVLLLCLEFLENSGYKSYAAYVISKYFLLVFGIFPTVCLIESILNFWGLSQDLFFICVWIFNSFITLWTIGWKIIFLQWIVLALLPLIYWLCLYWLIFRSPVLFQWCMCLYFCYHHTVLIIIILRYNGLDRISLCSPDVHKLKAWCSYTKGKYNLNVVNMWDVGISGMFLDYQEFL